MDFLPARGFEGARPGYVFKTGASGLGYYWDPRQPRQRAPAPRGAPDHGAQPQPQQARLQHEEQQQQQTQQQQQCDQAQDRQGQGAAAGERQADEPAAVSSGSDGGGGAAAARGAAPAAAPSAKAPAVVQKANPFLKLLKGKKVPAAAQAGGDAKRAKKEDDASKPAYLREMERYREMSCSADTKHDRPLVK